MINQNIILFAGLAVLAVYFVLFFKNSKKLTKDDLAILQKTRSKFMMITSVIPFIMIVFFRDYYVRLGLGVFILLSTAIETIIHHKKLRRLNFNRSYEKSLLKITYLSLIAMALIISWFIITART